MSDPNITYKTGFAELVLKLGRTPTMKDAELLALHEEYKKSWGPAEETVLAPVSAAGPQSGFSREPAPQARTGGEGARAHEGKPTCREGGLHAGWAGICDTCGECLWADRGATGAPDKPAEPEEAVTAPEPDREYPRASEPVLVVASAPCRACGREFERVARRGRPPVRCESCR